MITNCMFFKAQDPGTPCSSKLKTHGYNHDHKSHWYTMITNCMFFKAQDSGTPCSSKLKTHGYNHDHKTHWYTMITNCMFFEAQDPDHGTEIHIGPITLTLQELYISVVSTLIVFPPSIIIVTIFRRVRTSTRLVLTQANGRRIDFKSYANGFNVNFTVLVVDYLSR